MPLKDLIPWHWGDRPAASDDDPVRSAAAAHPAVGGSLTAGGGLFTPAIDVRETDEQVQISAEIPGLTDEDVQVHLSADGTRLTISGEKKEEESSELGGWRRMERRYGMFRRDLRLPARVEAEGVDARFEKGVLSVTLPKAAEQPPGAVRIAVGGG